MRPRLTMASAMALIGAGCSLGLGAHPAATCDSSADCPHGRSCYRGFCVEAIGLDCGDSGARVDCYTGPGDTAGVGRCRPGYRLCREGRLGPCLGELVPGIETCNAQDDDCDGRVDEVTADPRCDTGIPGECAEGRTRCDGPSARCVSRVETVNESCDGRDEDCDGVVDETTTPRCFPEGATGCVTGEQGYVCLGVCRPGRERCDDGVQRGCQGAVTAAPGPDGCTADGELAVDDDCDGSTDEDCLCAPGVTQPCYDGEVGTSGVGACTIGSQTCVMASDGTAHFGACVGMVAPRPETCVDPGVDDDCNGVVDDIEGLGDGCVVSDALGVCRSGTRACEASALTCRGAPPAATEVCDGRDDDCDGRIDEDFDLLSDPAHCGSCGTACGEGVACCDGECVDPSTSAHHCGACGHACGGGLSCCAGSCRDLLDDHDACGACGRTCAAEETCCAGSCADLESAETSCGACGVTCEGATVCCGGACAAATSPACTGCPVDCSANGETCCDGTCVDLDDDPASCGACGVTCGADQLCCDGACVDVDETRCGGCGITCAPGERCCAGGCEAADEANCGGCGIACGAGTACCDDACTDLSSSPTSCGGCGVTCAPGQGCSAGHCCPTGTRFCDGACVDPAAPGDPCGACAVSCNPQESCVDGCCCRDDNCRC